STGRVSKTRYFELSAALPICEANCLTSPDSVVNRTTGRLTMVDPSSSETETCFRSETILPTADFKNGRRRQVIQRPRRPAAPTQTRGSEKTSSISPTTYLIPGFSGVRGLRNRCAECRSPGRDDCGPGLSRRDVLG